MMIKAIKNISAKIQKRKNLLLFLALFLFSFFITSAAHAEDHYVTQNGGNNDGGNGTQADPWSVNQFNASANWDQVANTDNGKIGPGDTVFFSGMITTTVFIRGSGASGNYITLDGYESNDTADVAGGGDTNGFAVLARGIEINEQPDYMIFQDLRVTGYGQYMELAPVLIITNSDDADTSENLVFRRIHTYNSRGSWFGVSHFGSAQYAVDKMSVIDSKFEEAVTGECSNPAELFNISNVSNLYVARNYFIDTSLHATCGGEENSTNMVTMHNVRYALYEYNTIKGDTTGASLVTKEPSPGSKYIVWRFNNIMNNNSFKQSMGISTGNSTNGQYAYIYGNRISNVKEIGAWGHRGNTHVYFFSNIITGVGRIGFSTWSDSAGSYKRCDEFYLFNNTIAYTAKDAVSMAAQQTWAGLYFSYTDDIYTKNNIIYHARMNVTDGSYYPVVIASDVNAIFDSNLYYLGGHPMTFRVTNTGNYPISNYDSHALTSNPMFFDADGADNIEGNVDDNFTLQSGSPAINSGAVLEGPSVDIPFVVYDGFGQAVFDFNSIANTGYGLALDPGRTDWSIIPPTVVAVNQNDNITGWERGAYVFPELNSLSAPSGLAVW